MKKHILLSCMFFLSSMSLASGQAPPSLIWDICYEPIYSISERPSTTRSFSKTCTPLGRLEHTQQRFRDLALAIGDLDPALKRAKQAASKVGEIDFNTIRVKISMGPEVMFIDKTGSGVFRGKTFLLTQENMAKIERVLGAMYECMESRKEELEKQKPGAISPLQPSRHCRNASASSAWMTIQPRLRRFPPEPAGCATVCRHPLGLRFAALPRLVNFADEKKRHPRMPFFCVDKRLSLQ